MQHQGVSEEVDGGYHRDPLQDLDELGPPAGRDHGALDGAADGLGRELNRGDRAENVDPFQRVLLKFKGRAPAQTVGDADQDRLPVLSGVLLYRLHASGGGKDIVQHLVRAVGPQQFSVGVIAPGVHFPGAGEQILQDLQPIAERQFHQRHSIPSVSCKISAFSVP